MGIHISGANQPDSRVENCKSNFASIFSTANSFIHSCLCDQAENKPVLSILRSAAALDGKKGVQSYKRVCNILKALFTLMLLGTRKSRNQQTCLLYLNPFIPSSSCWFLGYIPDTYIKEFKN